MTDLHSEKANETFSESVELYTFDDLIKLGKIRSDILLKEPKSEDLAVVMYTSGKYNLV